MVGKRVGSSLLPVQTKSAGEQMKATREYGNACIDSSADEKENCLPQFANYRISDDGKEWISSMLYVRLKMI